ncbi:hypothetical protein ACFE04_010643 [Oxalis oulophora]
MGDRLRLAVGVMGNAASLLLYASPILTFRKILKTKSIDGYSCIPYVVTLLSCLIYSWYGLPTISYKWENFPLVKVAVMVFFVILFFCVSATMSIFLFHDHHHRKIFMGSIGLVVAASMYGSPLVVLKQVVSTKSVEFMPFYLSFFSFLSSLIWLAYGLLSHDLVLASPNMVGCPLAILQLLVYCKYRKGKEEPKNWDIEKNDEVKSKQIEVVVTNDNAKSNM